MENAAASDDAENSAYHGQSEEGPFRNAPRTVLGPSLVHAHQDESDETGEDQPTDNQRPNWAQPERIQSLVV